MTTQTNSASKPAPAKRTRLSAVLAKSSGKQSDSAENNSILKDVPLDLIDLDPFQPRKNIDEEELQALSDSIVAEGLIQPIVIRPSHGDRYLITAGERRYRATKLAGYSTIPALVKEMTGVKVKVVQLLENFGREDLTHTESIRAVAELINEYRLTAEQVAKSLNRSKSRISEYLLVYNSPDKFIEMLDKGVKLRTVVELCRLWKADSEFVDSHLSTIEIKDISLQWVYSLKSQLEQVEDADGKDTDVEGNADNAPGKDSDVEGNTDSAPGKDTDVKGDTDSKSGEDIDVKGDTDSAPGEDTDIKGDTDKLSGETYNNGNINIDIDAVFTPRPASQANIHVKFGENKEFHGVIAPNYLPEAPDSITIEIDDGRIVVVPIVECMIVGYE